MERRLMLRECVLFLEEEVAFHPSLSLKVGCGTQIYKFHDFLWNSTCKRWARAAEAAIPWPDRTVELELYHQGDSRPQVLGEGALPAPSEGCLRREMRISLLMDGLYVGCLFCLLDDGSGPAAPGNFLYLHKIDIILLEGSESALRMRLLNNECPAYQKEFRLHNRAKAIFPNLKIPVRMSDVLTVSLEGVPGIKDVRFVMDSVKRGKTSTYEAWLRNAYKNKVGDLKIEYFLENLYLDNERQVFTKTGLLPRRVKRITAQSGEDKERLRRSVIIRQLEEADRRIVKLSTSVRRLMHDFEGKENRRGQGKGSYRGTLRELKE